MPFSPALTDSVSSIKELLRDFKAVPPFLVLEVDLMASP
jgi:hypothetical protein